jgi:hypothetical protein
MYITSRYSGFLVEVEAHRQRLEHLPTGAGEGFQIVLVGELRVGDPELALQLRRLAADPIEPVIRLGVHARDEEARDRVHRRRVAAGLDETLDAADVRLHHLAMPLEGEDQRDVDVAA